MTIDEALDDYRMTFGEAFPLMCFMGVPEDVIIGEIYDCIDRETVFEPDEGVEY